MRSFGSVSVPNPKVQKRQEARLAAVDKQCRAIHRDALKSWRIVEVFGDNGIYNLPGSSNQRDLFAGVTPARGAQVIFGTLRTVRLRLSQISRQVSIPGHGLGVAFKRDSYEDRDTPDLRNMDDQWLYGTLSSVRMTYRDQRLSETAVVVMGDGTKREVSWHRIHICDDPRLVSPVNNAIQRQAIAEKDVQRMERDFFGHRKFKRYNHLEQTTEKELKGLVRAQKRRQAKLVRKASG